MAEETDAWICLACNGQVEEMGQLGLRLHGRCRSCGIDQSKMVEGEPELKSCDLTEEQLQQWANECKEWDEIRDEMLKERESVTAYQISLEMRKRMLARGQRPLFRPVRDK